MPVVKWVLRPLREPRLGSLNFPVRSPRTSTESVTVIAARTVTEPHPSFAQGVRSPGTSPMPGPILSAPQALHVWMTCCTDTPNDHTGPVRGYGGGSAGPAAVQSESKRRNSRRLRSAGHVRDARGLTRPPMAALAVLVALIRQSLG